ncbi:MAG TPA: hypothetical protein VKW09_12095 [bacterium]|nr:hypothetical protein [bacterium]
MDAWLKTHAIFVTAVSGALYLAGGDSRRLAGDGRTLALMVTGVREGFAAVRALGFPVTPFPLTVLFTRLPQAFVIRYWRRFFAAEAGDVVMGRHARAAAGEMRVLAADCRVMLAQSGMRAPALARLYQAIDAYAGR